LLSSYAIEWEVNQVAAPLWIFGYGSLIWRADFAFVERRAGYIKHWARRFWQGSEDHRGVPGAPGRVVTLVESPTSHCMGMAYRVATEQTDSVMAQLDYREKGGYDRLTIDVHFTDQPPVTAITYHATAANEHYLGPASAAAIANQVFAAAGPSGSNSEYVLELDQALQQLEHHDPHVTNIAAEVRRLHEAAK
jgi:cation transport regulator ChaC